MASQSASTSTTGRRRLSRVDRRASILAGSAAAFAHGGFEATSMADISKATGVSHLIVYRHFDSKTVLYEEVLDRAVGLLNDGLGIDGAIGDLGPTAATLLAVARADEAAFCVLWRHAAREPAFSASAELARAQLVERTRAALEGSVPTDRIDWAARATIAHLVEPVLVWVEDGDPSLDHRWLAAAEASVRAGVDAWSRPTADGQKRGEGD